MIDLKIIRNNPNFFNQAMIKRGVNYQASDILVIDEQHRHTLTDLQTCQNQRHILAKSFSLAKSKGEDTSALSEQAEQLKLSITALETKAANYHKELHEILSNIPNIPAEDCPEGLNETENVEILKHGKVTEFTFTPKSHFELGENLGLMDFTTAAKLSGSRFVILFGDLVRLERALAKFMVDNHCQNFGYQEVSTPLLVNNQTMFGTGQLPKFYEDQFQTTSGLWLIPTAEVTLTNILADEIVAEKTLPRRFTAHTYCFRAEAGAAGRDTRGLIRQHQFSKVELVSITTPEQSANEHERMTKAAETILQKLDLPYRKMLLCAGDMGFCAQKTYDLEVWLPSQNTYREISSCSNCGDFQARRMNARFRPHDTNGKPNFVHTLNGSGLAVGRTLVAVLENYQNADGSIIIPKVLIPYMGGQEIITKHNSVG